MPVNFFSHNVKFSLRNKTAFKSWVERTIRSEGHTLGEIDYIFCSDDHLLELNKKYLGHDTLTDIITFDYGTGKKKKRTGPKLISGDIFISIPRVKENAEKFSASFNAELSRVMIHGVLHLCGYGDKSPAEKKQMRAKEDHCLRILFSASK